MIRAHNLCTGPYAIQNSEFGILESGIRGALSMERYN
jgi:hypothetical protein